MREILLESHFDIQICRACRTKSLTDVIDLGIQPLANAFLKSPDEKEEKYPLKVCFCNRCKLLQLRTTVRKELMFKNYVYTSSTSPVFIKHFEDLAIRIAALTKDNDAKVIEVGSNDGILLKPLRKLVPYSVGIEPAENVAKIANDAGLKTETGWIDDDVFISKFLEKYEKADVVVACNVFAHVHKINQFLANVGRLMKPDGVFIVEVAHLLKLVENNYFDNFYHEHFMYWSLLSLKEFFKRHGFVVVDAEEIKTHGGSLRVYAKRYRHDLPVNDEVLDEILSKEIDARIHQPETFSEIEKRMRAVKIGLLDVIAESNSSGRKVIAYGAPAKGNTLLNFLGLTQKDIEFIVDDSPAKKDLYTPGSHIKVVSELKDNKHDILLLAWNFKDSIMQKLKESGFSGKFIIPFPIPLVIQAEA